MRIFNQLIGSWALRRDIIDHLGQSQLVGQINFTKISDTKILCEEKGVLNYNGHQIDASRTYIYELRDDKIFILYHDAHRSGDILHELEFTNENQKSIAQHCHQCGADKYDFKFEYSPDGLIIMNYVVKGPQKDYRMASELVRV